MYFTDVVRVLLRRWLIVLIGAIVVLAAAFVVRKEVPLRYQATGQMLLVLPAEATGVATPSNPYLNLQPGLSTTASLMTSAVSSKDTARSVAKAGFPGTYTADVLPDTGPIIVVDTKAATPAQALELRDHLFALLSDRLRQLQGSIQVPPRQVISTLTLSSDKQATPLHSDRLRAVVAVAGALLVATLVIAFVVDGAERSRAETLDTAKPERSGKPFRWRRRATPKPAAPALDAEDLAVLAFVPEQRRADVPVRAGRG